MKRKKVAIIVGCVISVAIIATSAFVVMNKRDTNEPVETQQEVVDTTTSETEEEKKEETVPEMEPESETDEVEESNKREAEYANLEIRSDTEYEIKSNRKLTVSETVLDKSLSNYLDEFDKVSVDMGYKTSNRSLYCDLLAVTYMNNNTLVSEFKNPNFSLVLYYISQMTDGDAQLDYASLHTDSTRGADYYRFIYNIDKDVYYVDSDGKFMVNGKNVDDPNLSTLTAELQKVFLDANSNPYGTDEDIQILAADVAIVEQMKSSTNDALRACPTLVVNALETHYDCPVKEVNVDSANMTMDSGDIVFVQLQPIGGLHYVQVFDVNTGELIFSNMPSEE